MPRLLRCGHLTIFSNYDANVKGTWDQTGILTKLEAKKKIFREPKESGMVDSVLEAYGQCIAEGKRGSLMLSVVGGKLSEGINFKDALGRCIIMVGLPFANQQSPELQEKMQYLNSLQAAPGGKMAGGREAGSSYYENLCMPLHFGVFLLLLFTRGWH
jgi:chromosome transmission fidelity protein 1